jgi:hypothetical protein
MRHRTIGLISTLALGLLAGPLPAEAQQTTKVYRIGYLSRSWTEPQKRQIAAFKQGLRELGYVEGQNYVIEYRSGKGENDRIPEAAAELVRLKVDVIVTRSSPAARAAKQATTTIPIVMAAGGDPVGRGLVASLAAAGLEQVVSLKQANVLEISAPAKQGILVTNPPYGVRLGEQQKLAEFYPKLGDVLKKKFSGWRAYILSAGMRLPKLIRLAASKRIPLFNGPLECRLFEYKMVQGGRRR